MLIRRRTQSRHASPRQSQGGLQRILSIRTLLKALAAATAGLCLAMLATGGTYALWNKSATIPGGTVSAGEAALQITFPLAMDPTRLYPGLTTYGTFVVTNTGTVPLLLNVQSLTGVTSNSFTQSLTVAVAVAGGGATVADCPAIASYPWSKISTAPIAGTLGSTLGAGASTTLCVSTTLASNAPAAAQSQTVPAFTLTIGGSQ